MVFGAGVSGVPAVLTAALEVSPNTPFRTLLPGQLPELESLRRHYILQDFSDISEQDRLAIEQVAVSAYRNPPEGSNSMPCNLTRWTFFGKALFPRRGGVLYVFRQKVAFADRLFCLTHVEASIVARTSPVACRTSHQQPHRTSPVACRTSPVCQSSFGTNYLPSWGIQRLVILYLNFPMTIISHSSIAGGAPCCRAANATFLSW